MGIANPKISLQDQYAPNSICFGCGPTNQKGLRIKSFAVNPQPSEDEIMVEAEFMPEPHHEAFPGMVNGGIIGALLDCHSNWAACYTLMQKTGANEPPCTVTADFQVKLRAPTPSSQKIRLRAKAVEISESKDRAKIEAQLFTLLPDGTEKLTATCMGTFVSVKPGHPAYHRWG
jgi:acyl-coenzyme A thioesterase PaaI-like protein